MILASEVRLIFLLAGAPPLLLLLVGYSTAVLLLAFLEDLVEGAGPGPALFLRDMVAGSLPPGVPRFLQKKDCQLSE